MSNCIPCSAAHTRQVQIRECPPPGGIFTLQWNLDITTDLGTDKVPENSENNLPGLYFSKALFEWLIFGGAYIRRDLFLEGLIYGGKFAFQNRLGQPHSWRYIYRFCFILLCIWGQFSKYKPPGSLYLEGRFNGAFFALPVWGAYIWMGLYMEEFIFGILRYMLYRGSVPYF